MLYRERIGLKLKTAHKEKKNSQTVVGKRIGVDHSVISKIEMGRFTGSLKTYENYLTSLSYVLSLEIEEPQQTDFDTLSELFNDE